MATSFRDKDKKTKKEGRWLAAGMLEGLSLVRRRSTREEISRNIQALVDKRAAVERELATIQANYDDLVEDRKTLAWEIQRDIDSVVSQRQSDFAAYLNSDKISSWTNQVPPLDALADPEILVNHKKNILVGDFPALQPQLKSLLLPSA